MPCSIFLKLAVAFLECKRHISRSFTNYVQEADLHSSVRIRELGITWQVLEYSWAISNSLNSVGKKEVTGSVAEKCKTNDLRS